MTSWALLWYTVGLVFHSLLEILVRAFFSLRDTKTPAFVSAGAMGLNIIFSIAFVALVQPDWLDAAGRTGAGDFLVNCH